MFALFLWAGAGCAIAALAVIFIIRQWYVWHTFQQARSACVVVGGDFARSPRMQYHAVSLSTCGYFDRVCCIGFSFGNECCEDVKARVKGGAVDLSRLVFPPVMPKNAIFRSWLVRTIYRVLAHVLVFAWHIFAELFPMLTRGRFGVDSRGHAILPPTVLIVQTPPAVPFLPLIKALIWLQTLYLMRFRLPWSGEHPPQPTKLIVDWHNLGYTLLEIDHRPKMIVNAYRFVEEKFGKGDYNLTVSQSMKRTLEHTVDATQPSHRSRFGMSPGDVVVLYDTAPAFFGPCSPSDLLSLHVEELSPPLWFVERSSNKERVSTRGLVMVSSTSWTADDDYTLVVEALKSLDSLLVSLRSSCKVWFVATGKGEARAKFEEQVKEAHFSSNITVTILYFQSFLAYSRMLGASDVGLSVHRSSSGLDLPMKVVDMFGSGLPVIALQYPALSELVDSESGWTFDDAHSLFSILRLLVLEDPEGQHLSQKRRHVLSNRTKKWSQTWLETMSGMLENVCPKSAREKNA